MPPGGINKQDEPFKPEILDLETTPINDPLPPVGGGHDLANTLKEVGKLLREANFILRGGIDSSSELPPEVDLYNKLLTQASSLPLYRELYTVMSDFLAMQSKPIMPFYDFLLYLPPPGEISPRAMDLLTKKLELIRLTQGQTGREIRRELLGIEPFIRHALPGMIGPEFLSERERIMASLGEFGKGKDLNFEQLAGEPLSPELEQLAANPEALYERVLMEHNLCVLQEARAVHWQTAAQGNLGGMIDSNPEQFLRNWLQGESWPAACGTNGQHLPRFLRDGHLLEIPEYDLPVAALRQLEPRQRQALIGAIDKFTRGSPAAQKRLKQFKISLQKFEDQEEKPFSFDPFEVVNARKAQLSGAQAAPAKKWTNLVGPLFHHAPKELGEAMLDTLGHIPEFPYTTKTFCDKTTFADLAGFHDVLRSAQQSQRAGHNKQSLCGIGSIFHEQRVLHARTQLLTHLFLGGQAETVRDPAKQQIALDTNGVRIDLPDAQTSKNSIHAHIPFPYSTDDLCAYWLEHGWLNEDDVREIKLRRAEANNDSFERRKLDKEMSIEFAVACDDGRRKSASFEWAAEKMIDNEMARTGCSYACAEIGSLFLLGGQSFVPRAILKHGKHIPISALRYLLDETTFHGSNSYASRVASVMQIIEAVQSAISDEVMLGEGMNSLPDQPHEKLKVHKTHKLERTAKDSYELRRKVLTSPASYEVAKMVGALLESGLPANSAAHRFMVFRGDFGTHQGQHHEFLQVVHKGKVMRVLLAPDKHLNKSQREVFESLPKLERAEYEQLETLMITYGKFDRLMWTFRCYKNPPYNYEKLNKTLLELNAILNTEFPAEYVEAYRVYNEFFKAMNFVVPREDEASREARITPYIERCYEFYTRVHNAYAERLFEAGDPHETVRQNEVVLQRTEVTFDEHFMDEFPADYLHDWTYDPVQSTCGMATKVVCADQDRSIPYAMEAKAIRALGLIPDRTLISVVGGCKRAEGKEDPLQQMGTKIMSTAHKHRANVAPPGTQSGLGAEMGRQWKDYFSVTGHLAAEEKARVFAVSPGGETYYPGNRNLKPSTGMPADEWEPYPMIPCDTIMTPFAAGWALRDTKAEAPYFQHVEYMEAIYQRLAEGKSRVVVVGNGGGFSIAEINAALKNNVPIILTKETGRFADFAIFILSNFAGWEAMERLTEEEAERMLLEWINTNVPDAIRNEVLRKDFGLAVPAEDPPKKLYRRLLFEFFKRAKSGQIFFSTIDDLDTTIETVITGTY